MIFGNSIRSFLQVQLTLWCPMYPTDFGTDFDINIYSIKSALSSQYKSIDLDIQT